MDYSVSVVSVGSNRPAVAADAADLLSVSGIGSGNRYTTRPLTVSVVTPGGYSFVRNPRQYIECGPSGRLVISSGSVSHQKQRMCAILRPASAAG